MSGGVDSTACALILKETYNVQGFFMQLAQPDLEQQKDRVLTIADRIGIKLNIIDLRKEFSEKVLNYFTDSYTIGITPNPCVICNREIKFGLFLDAMVSSGMDMMATGHYATIKNSGGTYRLYRGDDQTKDQSYFLSRLLQSQLAKILFPLGNFTKDTIYELVESHGFDDFRGRESQDICFLESKQLGNFLKDRISTPHSIGPIRTSSGQILGTHKGLYRYTIGQRKGLGISSDAPLYVVAIDTAANTLIVGPNEELFKKTVKVKDIHWLADTVPDLTRDYMVRIRYSHRGSTAKLRLLEDKRGVLRFLEPQRAVTPGQFAVLYNNNELLGSAIIE